jgi:hypothetical protein
MYCSSLTSRLGCGGANGETDHSCEEEAADILVSVHTNSTTDSGMDGSLALYFHRDDQVLAQAIYDVMYPYLRDISPHPEPKADRFTESGLDRLASGVLLRRDVPAAMMEPLFMSHLGEADWLTVTMHLVDGGGVVLLDEDGNPTPNPDCVDCRRAQIAQAIHDGIQSYFGQGGDGDDGGGGGRPCDSPPCGKGK